ncbi:MAG TPA: VTT domain-containing protein [Terracidiphilus sp.]|nr:VTT domain-containing protein [Terracidiphilus sp.]
MKQFFLHVAAYWKLVLLPALVKLGFWGAGAIAVLDSSSIPVPIDAFLAVAIWNDKAHFWAYVVLAAAGSAIGGLLPYALGRAGGELFLLKRINRERFEAIRDRFERQEFLAVMIPSMLPPPAPWKVFIFASGVFEMRIPYFLLAVFAGRAIRWSVLALLVIKLGPGAAEVVAHHAVAAAVIVGVLAAAGFTWWWMRWKRANKRLQG